MGYLTDAAKKATKETQKSADAVSAALATYLESSVLGVETVVVNRAGAILRDVALLSPVASGRFRAAWGPGFTALGAEEPRIPSVNREGESTDPREIAQGRREGRGKVDKKDGKVTAIVVNGTRYAAFLEAGASKQANPGFVRRTLDKHVAGIVEATKNIQTRGTK